MNCTFAAIWHSGWASVFEESEPGLNCDLQEDFPSVHQLRASLGAWMPSSKLHGSWKYHGRHEEQDDDGGADSFGIPKEVGLASWSLISLADQMAAQTAPW